MNKFKGFFLDFVRQLSKVVRCFFRLLSRQTESDSPLQRRRFVVWLVCVTGFFLLLKTGAITAFAKARRFLSPDTDPNTLIYEDPADLDTRNLPVSELGDYYVSGTDDHMADMDAWHLELEGLVQHPGMFSYSEVLKRPRFEPKVLLICPGTFAYVARWQGFSLWDLLKQQGIFAAATHVDIKGPPGKYRKVVRFHLDEVRNNNVFLAYGVNGQTLPIKHGFPLRVVAQNQVGANWVKYVYGIKIVHSDEMPKQQTPTDGPAFVP